jgi:uncharacterized protein (DUF2235 family)
VAIDERRGPFKPTLWSGDAKPGQVIEQRWFTGVHSDVGGGVRLTGLSDISLRWVMDMANTCGLAFDEALAAATIAPDPLSYLHDSMTGMYKLTPGYRRPIGAISAATETVSAEAITRMQDPSADYRPENLLKYLSDKPAGPGQTIRPAV